MSMVFGWIMCTGMRNLKSQNQSCPKPVFANIVFPLFQRQNTLKSPKAALPIKHSGYFKTRTRNGAAGVAMSFTTGRFKFGTLSRKKNRALYLGFIIALGTIKNLRVPDGEYSGSIMICCVMFLMCFR